MTERIDDIVVRNNLKSARVKKGLLQEDVAKALGITRQSFCKMERKPSNIKMKTYFALAELYEVPVSYFFGL